MEDLNENLDIDKSLDSIEETLSKEENIPELGQDFTEEKSEIQDEKTEPDSNQEIIEEIIEEKTEEIENSPETSNEAPSESIDIKTEDANTTNCLALTIQQDHKIVALKNVFLRSIRMSWKVAVSTITLALLKLFS